jgi:acyl carrier protein
MTRDEILTRLRDLLKSSFEIDPGRVTLDARLVQDLELDSIDAIDMVVQLEEWTGRRVPEEALRSISTVNDVVTIVEAHLAQTGTDAQPEPPGDKAG